MDEKRGYIERGYMQLKESDSNFVRNHASHRDNGLSETGPRNIENWLDVVRVPLQDLVVLGRDPEINSLGKLPR